MKNFHPLPATRCIVLGGGVTIPSSRPSENRWVWVVGMPVNTRPGNTTAKLSRKLSRTASGQEASNGCLHRHRGQAARGHLHAGTTVASGEGIQVEAAEKDEASEKLLSRFFGSWPASEKGSHIFLFVLLFHKFSTSAWAVQRLESVSFRPGARRQPLVSSGFLQRSESLWALSQMHRCASIHCSYALPSRTLNSRLATVTPALVSKALSTKQSAS